MTIRAKFTVVELTFWQDPHVPEPKYYETGRRITLQPVYDVNNIPEDRRYHKATPSGKIEMLVDNPTAIAEFTIGRQFYIDFIPVDESK